MKTFKNRKRRPFDPSFIYASVIDLVDGTFLALAEISWDSGKMESRRLATFDDREEAAIVANYTAADFAAAYRCVKIDTTNDVVKSKKETA